MVDVPDYLLERSRQRRAELTGGDATAAAAPDAGAAPAAGATAAVPAAPTPARAPVAAAPAAPPPPPPPDPPYVKAYKNRKKMPVWAMSAMVFLPVWAIFYVGMLEPPSSDELELASNGAAVFSTCSSCHGGDGGGTASGRQLNDGEVLLTFPADDEFVGLSEHISWVYLGTQGFLDAGMTTYGNPDRPGGQRETDSFANGMTGFSNLSLADLVSVVYYERVTHGGLDADTAAIEEELLLALAGDDPAIMAGTPEEISALLAASAEAHGLGEEEAAASE